MSTNNVMMTENDKRNARNTDLEKQIKEEKHKLNFIKDVDKLLKKYKLPKDYLYAALVATRQALRDGLRLFGGEVLVLHELVDVHPVAERGGHAARRRVRLLEIAHGDQLRQLVADRG